MQTLPMKLLSLRNYFLQPCLKRWFSAGNDLTRRKLSYSFFPGDQKLTHLTVGGALDEAVDLAGDNIAIVAAEQNISRTYPELRNDANRLASGLLSLGLRKGDRLAICAPNVYEWPVTLFAAAKAGIILVNINPAYRENELEYALSKAGCKAVIVSDIFKKQDFYSMLCSIVPELPNSKAASLQSKNLPNLRTVISLSNKPKSGTFSFSDILNAGDSKSDKQLHDIKASIHCDDPVNIQYTSGTTGNPKGAVVSHHNLINNAILSNTNLESNRKKSTVCCPLPVYHSFGYLVVLSSVLYQGTCVFASASFDVAAVMNAIEKYQCTRILGTPTMFIDLISRCEREGKILSSLEQAIVGGAPSSEQLLKDIRDKLKISSIREGYGTTETSPTIAVCDVKNEFATLLLGYRQPLELTEVKISNEKNQIVAIGDEGEICVRGYNVFKGYWDDKEKTDECIDKDRWYKTGDLGKMDEKGWIKIVGRIKDMVIRGGENIYPTEVENFLHSHPSVLEVHVCGVPDLKMGEELCAWIQLKEGENITEQDIKTFCKNKISYFKIPRYVLFVDDFPKTLTGKAQKFRMKEISIKRLGL